MSLEIIPIGTILAVLTSQVIKTANAASEVAFQKESFKGLSKYLLEIEPVLKALQLQELNDSQAARFALKSIENDVKKANNLVEKYRNRSRFFLFLKCRHIMKEIHDVMRDIESSVSIAPLANTDVLVRTTDQLKQINNEMQRVEFETPQSEGRILDRLNQGLREHKQDRAFANDMLEQIALAVGVPIEPSEISRELANFRKEKEDAAYNKQRADEFFIGQVIELLSRADAARDYEEVKKQYACRVRTMERYEWREEYVRPLNSFLCRVTGNVMVDPVSLCTGTTCERAAIVAQFESGNRTDPETHELLGDISLRSNLPLRQSIEEWRELRYCHEIRSLKNDLLSDVGGSILEALSLMQGLMEENAINRDWLSVEGLTDILVSILEKRRYEYLKREIMITLKVYVEGHSRNKEEVIDSRGWNHIVLCLGCDPTLSEASIELLYELLQERSGWNVSVCRKLSQESDSISDLVALLKDSAQETAMIAEKILWKLFEVDEDNYTKAAKAGWFEPLIHCIVKGSETSRLSIVKAVLKMELDDSELDLLGKEGVIPILIEMASGNMEWKDVSLSALAKLSESEANRHLITKSGGVRFIVGLMLSPLVHTLVAVRCCNILEKISSSEDAIRFFVDENGVSLDLELIVTNLLILLQTQNLANSIRRPALRTLLEVCKFEAGLVKKAILTIKDLSQVLLLLDDSDSEIREITLKLLFLFSQHKQDGIVEYLLRPRRVEALVGFLENEGKDDVKLAAAGLLVNLSKSETKLNEALIACNAHVALVDILKPTTSTEETKENALGALLRLTDPESLESQRAVVRAGAHPLLVKLLRTGSITAKARAASLLGNLSTSSQKLTDTSRSGFFRCLSPKGVSLCPAHGGVCSAESSFCLVDSEALPALVELLLERVAETAEKAISALSTLVNEAAPGRGVEALHRAGAIQAVVESVNWGSTRVKDKALGLLEKVFASRDMAQNYLSSAKNALFGITGASVSGDDALVRKAAKILALLERNSRSSMSFLSRSSGRIAT